MELQVHQTEQQRESESYSEIVLNVMRFVEGEWNAGSISGSLQNSEAITTTQTNRRIEEDRDGTQQMVSSVIVNERGSSFYGLESLSENVVDIRQLDDRWQGENTQIISYTTPH